MSQDHTHPNALTILTSTVLRNRVPTISTTSAKLNFERSFRTVGTHNSTQKALKAVSVDGLMDVVYILLMDLMCSLLYF